MRISLKRIKTIGIHSLVWLCLILLFSSDYFNLNWGPFIQEERSILFPMFYGFVLGAIIFYLNTHWLIPEFFGKQHKGSYWARAFLLFMGVTILEILIDTVYLTYLNWELAKVQFETEPASVIVYWLVSMFFLAASANLLCWILAFAYQMPRSWLANEKQKNQLEKDKLRAELEMLKSQINPHFLFNGINSIYHMIGEDDGLAKSTLLKFSGLLRYQLYECNEEYIPLSKEIDYISNYFSIERVRKGEDAKLTCEFINETKDKSIKSLKIIPLLFAPFLENAFKYLSDHSSKEQNYVRLKLMLKNDQSVEMNLVNTYNKKSRSVNRVGGIGLSNVKRRLAITYPDNLHQIEISDNDKEFKVHLIIQLR